MSPKRESLQPLPAPARHHAVGSGSPSCCGLPSRVGRGGGCGPERGGLGKPVFLPSPELAPLVCVPSCSAHAHQRDLGLATPLDLPGFGAGGAPSLASFLGILPSPAHPCPSAHSSSEPVHSHPASRLPQLGSRGLRRKRSLLRKNSVASVMVGQEVGDSQKCGHCGQRVCGSASKELPGLPRSPSQMLCEGGQGTWRPEELRLFFPLISPALGHSD